jgi:hypothetical protein
MPGRAHELGPVEITLTDAQVAWIVRDASGEKGLAGLFSGLPDLEELRRMVLSTLHDPRQSLSVLRAVLVLAAFPSDGSWRDLAEVAGMAGLSASTTYRYVRSWVSLRLIEQDPSSRQYRRTQ